MDIKNKCYIKIKPSFLEFSNLNIKRAINVLKYGAPTDYKDLCENVKVIDPNLACGGFEGGCYYLNAEKAISISTSNRSLSWTAAVMGHEVCHAMQFNEGRELNEPECYRKTDEILKKLVEL